MSADKPHRKILRLTTHNYSSAGAYFITICTFKSQSFLGKVRHGKMILNALGHIVQSCWIDLPRYYDEISLDAYVVMPDHFHGIIYIESEDNLNRGRIQETLPSIIRSFKSFSSRFINNVRQSPGAPVWQKSYYDMIIRSHTQLVKVRRYIAGNPYRWKQD